MQKVSSDVFDEEPPKSPERIAKVGPPRARLAALSALAGSMAGSAPSGPSILEASPAISKRFKDAGAESMVMSPQGPRFRLRPGVTPREFRRALRRGDKAREHRNIECRSDALPPLPKNSPEKIAERKAAKGKKLARERKGKFAQNKGRAKRAEGLKDKARQKVRPVEIVAPLFADGLSKAATAAMALADSLSKVAQGATGAVAETVAAIHAATPSLYVPPARYRKDFKTHGEWRAYEKGRIANAKRLRRIKKKENFSHELH